MPEILYARMLPSEPKKRYRGMIPRQRVMIPDENGVHRLWDSGDRNWTEVSPEHGAILKGFVLQPWRRGQICPFEVCTLDEVKAKQRHYAAQRAINQNVPGPDNARKLDGGGLAGQQGIPEPEAPEVVDPRDARIADLEEQMERMAALVEGSQPTAVPTEDDQPQPSDADAIPIGPPDESDEPVDVSAAVVDLVRVRGIGQKSATALADAGIMSVEELAASDLEAVTGALSSIPSITKKRCARWMGLAAAMAKTPAEE